MKNNFLSCAILALALGGAARAQVLTYDAQIPLTPTSWTKTLQLPGFKSSLGQLTQVLLTFSSQVQQQLLVVAGNSAGAYDFTTTASVSIVQTGGPVLLAAAPIVFEKSGYLTRFDDEREFDDAPGFTLPPKITNVGGAYRDGNLARYLDAGLIGFTIATTSSSALQGPGNITTAAFSSASARVAIQYTYTAIPEPAAYAAVLGVAVAGLVVLRQRRVTLADSL